MKITAVCTEAEYMQLVSCLEKNQKGYWTDMHRYIERWDTFGDFPVVTRYEVHYE